MEHNLAKATYFSGTLGLCMGWDSLDACKGVRQIDRDRKLSWNQLHKTLKAWEVECEIDGRISWNQLHKTLKAGEVNCEIDERISWNQLHKTLKAWEVECEIDGRISW